MLALLAQTFWSHPAVIGVIIGIPATAIAVLGYRRSVRTDAIAAQSDVAENKREGVEQVIEGLNKLLGNVQNDNEALRVTSRELNAEVRVLNKEVRELNAEVRSLNAKLSLVVQQNDELKQQIIDLNAKIP